MTSAADLPPPTAQTPAQWAVRWFALVAVAALCAVVPLVHVAWHVALGHDEPILRTRSQKSEEQYEAAFAAASFQDGTWMTEMELYLREASPVTWWLRGNWNELRYRTGVPESREVHFGKHDWLFIHQSVFPNNRGYERATDKRRKFLADVRDLVRAAGAELFLMVVPDKARIYPDYAFPDGAVSARKAGNYERILAELGELGIATVDLATPMAAARGIQIPGVPPGELYYARDTHWRPPGALIGGRIVADAIEARFGDRLGPRRPMVPSGETVVRAVGDLTGQLGLLTIIEPDPVMEQRTVPLSLLSDSLAEVRSYYGVNFVTEQGLVGMYGDDPDAEILVIGTSFSEENGMNALSLSLGRAVRGVIVRGAQGMLPLREALAELRRGTKAKVVVWELVERGMFEGDWLDPAL
jgi:alginate O-acetyltransferase complex protein AlgJ